MKLDDGLTRTERRRTLGLRQENGRLNSALPLRLRWTSPEWMTRRISPDAKTHAQITGKHPRLRWYADPTRHPLNIWEFLVSDMAAAASRKLARACADFLWAQDATLRGFGLSGCRSDPGKPSSR